MNYYIIHFTLNSRLRGKNNYIKESYPLIDNKEIHFLDEPKFIGNIYEKKIEFTPYLAAIHLFDKANLLDLIMSPGFISKKLVLSTKLKRIFEKNRSSGLQFFKIPVFHKNELIDDYWILNFYETNMEIINFTKSHIYLTENTFTFIEKLNINSYDEYLLKKQEIDKQGYPSGILIKKYEILDNVNHHFVLLNNVEGGVNYLASERLKIEIEKSGCTGIEFQPIEFTLTEWLQGGDREKVYGKS